MTRSRLARSVVLVLLGLLLVRPVAAQPKFIEVGELKGIGAYLSAAGWGRGISAADYDNDGDVDLFVPNERGVSDELYRNRGDGTFEEVSAFVGLGSPDKNRAGLWFDYDGDHDLDLVVAGDCFHEIEPTCFEQDIPRLRVFRQDEGLFTEVTDETGITGGEIEDADQWWEYRSGFAAGDFNGDGFLDLLVSRWGGFPCMSLFLNNRDGTFRDATASSGILIAVCGNYNTPWQPLLHDFNNDGRLDIFITMDFVANVLLINQGNETFVDIAVKAGVADGSNNMGVCAGDVDNDGDIDLYTTNVFRGYEAPAEVSYNTLYRNDTVGGTVRFTDISQQTDTGDSGWGWGCSFIDVNNDGRLDIAATNGYWAAFTEDQSKLFLNLGGEVLSFRDASAETGFDDTFWGFGLVALDFDRDGDQDLFQSCNDGGPLRLLENQLVGSEVVTSHVVVRPRMEGPNHYAIGAVVRLESGGLVQTRLITAGTSVNGQEPAEAFFGLSGVVETVDRITVEWPNGETTELEEVVTGGVVDVLHVSEGPTFVRGDCNGDGIVIGSPSDAVMLAQYNFAGGRAPPCLAACDANNDGEIAGTVSDIIFIVQFNFLGGRAPAPPYPACGAGAATVAALGCAESPGCP